MKRTDDIKLYNKLYYQKYRERLLSYSKNRYTPMKKIFCEYCQKDILITKKNKHEISCVHKQNFKIKNEHQTAVEMAKNMFN
jgi:septin family protein